MSPWLRPCLVVLLCLFGASAALAASVQLDGEFVQGGLIVGTAPPGTSVALNGRPLRVSPQGRFLFGFGRDAEPEAVLALAYPDGSKEERHLAVAARKYKIQRIDGLPPSKVNPPAEVLERIKRENEQIAELRKVDRPEALFESGWRWPAIGPISGVYGSQRILNGEPKQPHYGVDIAAPEGTPVLAPAAGIIVLAEPDLYYTGGTVILDHGFGLSSAFLHMQKVEVTVGQRIAQGDRLGTLGGTGRATGPHLDWRINWFEERIDPALLVPPMPSAAAQ